MRPSKRRKKSIRGKPAIGLRFTLSLARVTREAQTKALLRLLIQEPRVEG